LIETDVSDELISIVYDKLKDLSIKDNIRLIIHGGEPLISYDNLVDLFLVIL
jgi:sulfatase maturation enzyme AslB (radical SAM superfamily)